MMNGDVSLKRAIQVSLSATSVYTLGTLSVFMVVSTSLIWILYNNFKFFDLDSLLIFVMDSISVRGNSTIQSHQDAKNDSYFINEKMNVYIDKKFFIIPLTYTDSWGT